MEKFEIIAKTIYGLEEILAEELKQIGAEQIEILPRAVKYYGDQSVLYKSNLYLRTAIKVLKPIVSFKADSEQQLYNKVKRVDWKQYMDENQTLAIDGITSGEIFTHSKFVALKTKDAIVDQFRDRFKVRPSIDVMDPDLRVTIHIQGDKCSLLLDSSGLTLAKRGYREEQTAAPISEVLAAGMLYMTGWDRKRNVLDPMCGSGTIAVEAALMATNTAPGSFRHFAFEKWKDFDAELWKSLEKEAMSKRISYEGKIVGNDIDEEAIDIATWNARRAGVSEIVSFSKKDFTNTPSEVENPMIVINPPYGERLNDPDEIIPFYQEIGTSMKHNYDGSDAWIISSNLRAMKFIGLRPSRKIKLFNAKLECRFMKFELYRGSKRASKN